MTATLASNPWPATAAPQRDAAWRFGCAFNQPAQSGWLWDLRRNGPTASRNLVRAYGMLCVVVLALGFWSQGARLALLLASGELMLVGLALLLMARHAGDREFITLTDREMAVEQRRGPSVERTRFRAEWVRVEPAVGEGSLVELSGEGQRVLIGRHVRPELRFELAQELRTALRLSRGRVLGITDLKHDNEED
jgi:uncharacterized membrane protein